MLSNSLVPDQTPRFVASDMGLHCLLMSHLWDGRHIRIKHLDNIASQYSFVLRNFE